jgi:hypothetical protein
MPASTNLKTTRRGLFVTIIMALVAGVAVFAFLWFVTGGFFIAIVAAAVLIAILGTFHYVLWGRTMVGHAPVVYSRPRVEGEAVPNNISLPLDERERAELIRVLDRTLAEPNGPPPEARPVLQNLRERLERYGA